MSVVFVRSTYSTYLVVRTVHNNVYLLYEDGYYALYYVCDVIMILPCMLFVCSIMCLHGNLLGAQKYVHFFFVLHACAEPVGPRGDSSVNGFKREE